MSATTLTLRPLTPEDDPAHLVAWLASAADLAQWGNGEFSAPLTATDLRAHVEAAWTAEPPLQLYWGMQGTDRVAYGELTAMDLHTREARLGHLVVDPRRRGLGTGTALCRELLRVAFGTAALEAVTTEIVVFNRAALGCARATGFVESGDRPQMMQLGGKWWSGVLMRCDRQSWRRQQEQHSG